MNGLFFVLIIVFSLLARIKVSHIPLGGIHYLGLSFLGLLIILLHPLRVKNLWFKRRSLLISLVIFYLWMWVSAWFSDFSTTALKYGFKYSVYPLIFLVFLVITFENQDALLNRLAFGILIIIAMIGILESIFPHSEVLNLIRYPDSYPRISSIMQGPNQFGVLMSIGAMLALSLYKNRSITKLELCISLSLFILLTAQSASRNAWFVFTIGILLLWLMRIIHFRGSLVLASCLAICILSLPVSYQRLNLKLFPVSPINQEIVSPQPKKVGTQAPSSYKARLVLWQAAIDEFSKKPITGIGIGTFAEHVGIRFTGRTGFHVHNIFLQVLVELGIPGCLLFMLFLGSLMKHINLDDASIVITISLVLLSQMVDCFINDYGFTAIALYFVAAAANSSGKRHQRLFSWLQE
ncbi:MAG TPA: hypothetical protein DDW76_24445 [Cyanobacteria bacterium UBA11369]|nr:hypothetical protein [Cyanobacteria bacterium UBA11371]HBE32372.1 hypothetical protein [Cyanobacteria bacterium UBA11368]HBE51837.1 hypothetical protein [Cyanobacteria bacterium UBA11369]